jgi:hypothetical protein
MSIRFLSLLLTGFCLTALAEDDLRTTGSMPTNTPAKSTILLPDASLPNASATAKKEPAEKWGHELLRDPFWPVGHFPPDWRKKTTSRDEPDLDGSGWKAASAKIQVSGTSRLSDRTAAIIDGELKSVGDQVEILHEGKTYQWEIIGIDTDGQIRLKKLDVRRQ